MIRRIYLDLDDVLNTLVPHALTYFTVRDGKKLTYADYPRECGWDIVGAANKIRDEWSKPWTRETFWGSLKRGFWATIPRAHEYDWLISLAVYHVGREGVFILTKAVGAESLAGKQDWIERNLPEWLHDRMITCAHKDCCAAPDSLLIDDNQDNIQAFAKRGGQVIMRPRPWNDLWELGDRGGVEYVLSQLRAILGRKGGVGRTRAMLAEAYTMALKGDRPIIVGASCNHAMILRNRFIELYGNTIASEVLFVSMNSPNLSFSEHTVGCTANGCVAAFLGSRSPVLVDHYALDCRLMA